MKYFLKKKLLKKIMHEIRMKLKNKEKK